MNKKAAIFLGFFFLTYFLSIHAMAQNRTRTVKDAELINPCAVQVAYEDGNRLTIDFYGENIVRLFEDPHGGIVRDPVAKPPAEILVKQPRKPVSAVYLTDRVNSLEITTGKMIVSIEKSTGLIQIKEAGTMKTIVEMISPVEFGEKEVALKLKEGNHEYFYGGGVQNGRFSHKGKAIAIENQNSWTDGGVASPTPFYWSTKGYGFMWYTFKKGIYDFGAKEKGVVRLSHETDYLDIFFMVNDGPVALLNDFYQLTGHPVLLPKFGFYEGHLNAYNRDFWKEDSTGILFEDGKRYKESQKDNGGIKESLNGEKKNYQFSARAVIDRYATHDMPFGWILPNDGYGAGYGQTNTLEGNVANLKSLGDYARSKGVQIGLWTQSDLHPIDTIPALLQRDIVREVRDAGVRVLKTDVAWVGAGYSFGLNGVADVGHIMPYYGKNARPFIISVDGWAGTQRYATIWSGDQTGGVWEYIRFHIPTYIGSGLSGNPNITSDMDGIFGGKNPVVNIRDFQWKTFTPMQLNMDGWGSNPKYPFALGEPATSINRNYLKLKSELMPYAYSIAHQAVDGKPMIRAMFLDYPNDYTHGVRTQYQFMYGPSFLVAPIYQATHSDSAGNDIRNGIYLPEGQWIDYFTGQKYEGNRIINYFEAPIWKLPVFIKAGSIIPMTNPNNNVTQIVSGLRIYEFYPKENSSFTEYDDDGITLGYKDGKHVKTLIESEARGNRVSITIHPAEGGFDGFQKNKTTRFIVNVTEKPSAITLKEGGKNIKLREVKSKEELLGGSNVYFYDPAPDMNRFSTPGSEMQNLKMITNPKLMVQTSATDITQNALVLTIGKFKFDPVDNLLMNTGTLQNVTGAHIPETGATAFTLTPVWQKNTNADYCEIRFNNQIYSTITADSLLFEGLQPETTYNFEIRAVNKNGYSGWSSFSGKTKPNPLEFAIKGISATSTAPAQSGNSLRNLFDFDESNMWHTRWGEKAVPFDIIANLGSVNQLDKLQYLPRDRGNGILLEGTIAYGHNRTDFSEPVPFKWVNDGTTKEFVFKEKPTALYLKIHIDKGVGNFGSGREMYVFKVPGSASYLPGDINADRLIDANDLTSYTNYMGLRMGDADFEGYVSRGDVNKNDLIDVFDVSNVTTRMRGGVRGFFRDTLQGSLQLVASKTVFNPGDVLEITVKGNELRDVNALGFALPYNQQEWDFAGITPLNMEEMENISNDRLHTNGQKELYVGFINVGNKKTLSGNNDLFIIRFKARKKAGFNLKLKDGLMVDKQLNSSEF